MSTAERLAAKAPKPQSWWTWATVTVLSPLSITLDGESAPLAIAPEDHVGGLAVDDRVRVHFHFGRAYVVSTAGGPVIPPGMHVGEHRAGEWVEATKPEGTVLADGSVLNIADWPALAAHYAATYGTANHHGGNGTTTFAVPDTRQRTYVNRGASGIFATLGALVGALTHSHSLSNNGWADIRVATGSSAIWANVISIASRVMSVSVAASGSSISSNSTNAVPLSGATDAASTVQPSFVCQHVIQAI